MGSEWKYLRVKQRLDRRRRQPLPTSGAGALFQETYSLKARGKNSIKKLFKRGDWRTFLPIEIRQLDVGERNKGKAASTRKVLDG